MKKKITLKLNNIKDNKGMTLVELLMVMAILGILMVIGSDMFLSYRAKAYDATAMSDGRQFLTAVLNSVIADDDVNYEHAPENGNRVGAVTLSDGGSRDPIMFLSESTRLRTDEGIDYDPGTFYLEAHFYSVGGTPDSSPSGKREFTCYMEQTTGLYECSFD